MKQLKDIMTQEVEVVHPDTDLVEIARLMKERNVGALPVCEGDKIQGIITDRDIVVRAMAQEREPHQTRARDVMTKDVHWCYADDTLEHAARVMQAKNVRRLIVVDRQKNLCGLLSTKDLALGVSEERAALQTLKAIARPSAWSDLRSYSRWDWRTAALGAVAVGLGAWLYSRRETQAEEAEVPRQRAA